ncbi:MAG TPA: GatB/YqeY domain-containing protein [Dehalococcoidia bacterium]
MTLKERIAEDLKAALRSGDEARKTALRLVTAAVRNAEIAAGRPLEDADVLKLIQREARQHEESIQQFQKAGREDLVRKEQAELAVLASYLPSRMSREEIVEAARAVIQEVGAAGPRDKGRVMGVLMPRLGARADGREVNQVVTELLEDFARP